MKGYARIALSVGSILGLIVLFIRLWAVNKGICLVKLFSVNTVKTLTESILINSIAISGFFISYFLVRAMIKSNKLREYL